MKVFVKRYPEKGDLPSKEGFYHTDMGLASFNKTFDWVDHHNYTCPCPDYWLEEIELPSEEDIRREALGPFKEKDLEDQYGDFIQDDIDTFTKGANYIINLLKQKDNETN